MSASVDLQDPSSLITIDNIHIPSITRNGKVFVPVRVTEQKLLQPVMTINPSAAMTVRRPLLSSFYLTLTEATQLTSCAGHLYGTFTAGVDLIVDLNDFCAFYAELKSVCLRAEVDSICSGGWVQINNSVIPFVDDKGDKLLPLSIVQNAARLLANIDKSVLPHKQLSTSQCNFVNTLCQTVGLQFAIDPQTAVIEISYVRTLAHRPPFVRFLPNDDPFGSAEYVDLHETETTDNTETTGHSEPVQSVEDSNSTGLRIVDVRSDTVPFSVQDLPNGNLSSSADPSSHRSNALMNSDVQTQSAFPVNIVTKSRPFFEPITVQNRTVSSLRRSDGKNYLLLEAICRVFFPTLAIDAFVNCIEHVLQIPVTNLTAEEQRFFIEFYHLPTDCLRCRKLIIVDNFEQFFPQIQYSFRSQIQDSTNSQSVPSTISEIRSLLSNTERRKNAPVPLIIKRKRAKVCDDVIVIDD